MVDPASPVTPGAHYPLTCPAAGGLSPTAAWSDNWGEEPTTTAEGMGGVIDDDDYMEEQEEEEEAVMAGAEVTPDARWSAEGSSPDRSEEGEEEEEQQAELRPCPSGRAEQQRKEMRRAMSECSHLSVPSGLVPPDQYPGGAGPPETPAGGPRRSAHSPAIKRSLTVAEDPQPPQTLSAAGATRADLSQPADPGPAHHFLSAPGCGSAETRFPPLDGAAQRDVWDGAAETRFAPLEGAARWNAEEQDGVSLCVPPGPGARGTAPLESGSGPAPFEDALSPVPDSGPRSPSGHGDDRGERRSPEPSGWEPGAEGGGGGGDAEGFCESGGDAGDLGRPPGTSTSVSLAAEGRWCSLARPPAPVSTQPRVEFRAGSEPVCLGFY